MRDRLVLANAAPEDPALARIARSAVQGGAAYPDRFRGDEDSLGVHAMQNKAKAVTLGANPIGNWNAHAVEKELVGIHSVATHLFYGADAHARAVQIGVEKREPLGAAFELIDRRSAREHQHLVCDLRGRYPDFLPGKDVVIVFAGGAQLDRRGLEPCVRLSDGKTGLVFSGNQRRQHAPFLLIAAENDDRLQPEDVHVYGGGSAHGGAGFGNCLHHERSLGNSETGAAVLLRHGDAQPPRCRDCRMELVWEFPRAVLLEPIGRVEARAKLANGIADLLLLGGEAKIHGFQPADMPPFTLMTWPVT